MSNFSKYGYGDEDDRGYDNSDSRFEMHEFTGKVKHISEKAILMIIEGEQMWLPFSQIEYNDDPIVGLDLSVDIPGWLAEKNGLI